MDNGKQEDRRSNPRERANIVSFLTFAYTFGLFKRGIKGNLQEKDIYAIPDDCDSKQCGDKTEQEWKQNKVLLNLLWKRFGVRYCILTGVHLAWTLINSIVHPYALSRFISYFQNNRNKISKNDAFLYAGIVIFLSVFHCFWAHNYFMLECKLELKIKASLTSLIYRKVLKLRPGEISETSMGNIVTILTKDIRTVVHNIWTLSDMIVGTIQMLTIFYLLYSRMGLPSTIAMGLLCTGLIIQVIISRMVTKMRLKVGRMVDKRLQLTQEALSALRIIKMYTWEMFFQQRIYQARKKEMKTTMRVFYLKIFLILIGLMGSKITFPILLISYVALGYATNTELVFYIMGLFKELRHSVGISIPLGLTNSAEFYASLTRVSRVLHIEEHYRGSTENTSNKTKVKVEFKDVSVSIGKENILKNVSFNIANSGLTIVTGLVGSGKSSLLKAILRDYPNTKGTINVSGSISYASQDPWLFPSSIKQNILFGLPFDKLRYDKTVKVCSLEYDFNILPDGDETIVIDRGMNLSKGQQARLNLARAIYKDSDIYLLDDSLAALDVRVQEDIFTKCIRDHLKNKMVFFVSQNPAHFKSASHVILLNHGSLKSITKPAEAFSEELENLKNKIIATFDSDVKKDEKMKQLFEVELDVQKEQKKIYQEDKKMGSVDLKTYHKYFKFGGGLIIFCLCMCIYFGAQFTESYSEKLVSRWVDYQQQTYDIAFGTNITKDTNETVTYDGAVQRRDRTFNLYTIMISASAVLAMVKSYSLLRYCRKASVNIHQAMCQSVINSMMSFLDNHFIGNILNRFSYDLDVIDEQLPFIFMEFFRSFISIGGMLILIATVNWIFLLFALGFFSTLFIIRLIYMPTGRALKRLEAMTRSPLIGHLNASVEGLTTIRAYKAEEVLKDEFDKHQDLANSSYYMMMTTKRAFGYVMDFMGSMFVIFIILILLFVDTHISVGNVGLALTQVFMLTGYLQWAVRQWADLENCMTSVERVLEYTDVNQEDKTGGALNEWPKDGSISYENVSLCYNSEAKVLKEISFRVNPTEKIGIVGRTGAGKSSIISTLFRLYNYEGRILIDGIDITSVSINFLRKSISIIPQDPIIFEGSVRDNMDPYKIYKDQEIWQVLDQVRVKDLIPTLDDEILSLNLSTGQKQLLSLARAIIKRNKLVVLDEATANMDEQTDELVQQLIQENFIDCTVIMIAHRLSTIMHCDKVMVMDNGNIVEFDNPKTLLNDKNSLFYAMKTQTSMDS